jgi:probable phosphoglycerate mutase
MDYQQSPWLAPGWVVETAGDVSHLDRPALDEVQR